MSGDIALFLQTDQTIDIGILGNDLATDDGLRTAVLISLFTDRRVDQEEVPAEETSRKGWWADLFPDVQGDQIGSRLWLLKREKRTLETLNRAEEYSIEALQWMIDDGVAESVDASASYDDNGALALAIMITQPQDVVNFRFKLKWGTEAERS